MTTRPLRQKSAARPLARWGVAVLALVLLSCGGKSAPKQREVILTSEAVDDDLLGGGPAVFRAQASHLESVLELPPGATRLATTDLDPNHAFRVGRSAWGVQFHPEFDADITRGYLRARRAAITSEGLDVDRLIDGVAPAPHATRVLRRFAGLLAG